MAKVAHTPMGSPWQCTAVPTAVHTDDQHAVSTKTAVFFIRRSTRSCCQTVYYWMLHLLCLLRSHTERPTGRRHLSLVSAMEALDSLEVHVSAHLQKTTKTASVSTFISWPTGLVL